MSKHSKTTFIRVRDGTEVSADEAFSKDGLLKSGFSIRTPMYMVDSVPKSGFQIDDQGRVFKDGKPYTVPLELGDDGIARPTLDRRRRKTTQYDPDGNVTSTHEEVEEAERMESDADTLLADGSTVASHRPGFYRGPRDQAALDRLDAIYETVSAMDSERWKTAHSSSPSSPADSASGNLVEDAHESAYEAYDREMNSQYLKNKG